jgi:hypothetical protein
MFDMRGPRTLGPLITLVTIDCASLKCFRTCVRPNKQMLFIFPMCHLENVDIHPLAWGHIFDMREPCALGPITVVPIECDSLNTFQICVRFNKNEVQVLCLRPLQQKMKKCMCCTCVRFNKNEEVHVLYLRPFQQKMKKFMFCTCVRFNKNEEVSVLYLRPFQRAQDRVQSQRSR